VVRAAVEKRFRIRGEVFHREMYALQVTARNGKIARVGCAGADHRGIEVLEQQQRLDILPDLRVTNKLDALLLQQLDAPHDDALLVELHVRNAVHQQSAGAIVALQHGDRVSGTIEL